MNSLAILTVIYENYDVLGDLIKSLEHQTNSSYHLYIADLSSHKKTLTYPKCTVIDGKNLGYAYGINITLKAAIKNVYKNYAVLNSDTIVAKEFVEKVVESIHRFPSSLIGGKIYYAPGFEYHKDRYQSKDKGKVLWYAGGRIDWKNVYIQHLGVDEIDAGQYDNAQTTNFITGCFIAFNKASLDKIGSWDEKYFLYYEDADFCERAKHHGVKLYYDPSIILWHKNAQSTSGSGSKLHQKLQRESRFQFGLKFAPWKTKFYLIKNHYLNL